MPKVVTVGETLALLVPEEAGLLRHTRNLHLRIGGAESNVAIGLQRLGVAARWVGRVGDDSFGDLVLSTLRSEGVDVRGTIDATRPTAFMLKEHRTPQTQQISYFRSASAGTGITDGDLSDSILEDVSVVHTTGITCALSASTERATERLLERARALGITTSFDVNYRRKLWHKRDPRAVLAKFAHLSDVLFASLDEAALLTKESTPEAMASAIAEQYGAREVVLKMGPAGSLAFVDKRLVHEHAIPIHAVDTIGAGDAFVAGYLSQLVEDTSVQQRLHRGSECGAFACLSTGDWEGAARATDLHLLYETEEATR